MTMETKDKTYRIIATGELLEYLSPKEDKRYSKMDAFIYLLDKTACGTQRSFSHDGQTETLLEQQVAVKVTKLAEAWGWHRETVRNFLQTLEKMDAIRVRSEAKCSIITFNLFSTGDNAPYSHPMSDDEVLISRWICGHIATEEMVDEIVQTNTEMQSFLAGQPADKTHTTGIRLHKIVSHWILQHTNLIPADDDVAAALSELFHRYCNQNLTCFSLMFALSGLRFISGTGDQKAEPMFGITSPEARRCLDTIAEYYLPFVMKAQPLSAKEPPSGGTSDK